MDWDGEHGRDSWSIISETRVNVIKYEHNVYFLGNAKVKWLSKLTTIGRFIYFGPFWTEEIKIYPVFDKASE